MKNRITWAIKLLITLGLLASIFMEFGEDYIPVQTATLLSDDAGQLIYRRAKKRLGMLRGHPEATLSNLYDLSKVDDKHVYLIKTGVVAGVPTFKIIDRDVHYSEDRVDIRNLQVLVELDGQYVERHLGAVTEATVYLKTRGWWRVAPIRLADLITEIKSLDMSIFWFWIVFAFLIKMVGVFASLGRWTVLLHGQNIYLPFRYLLGTFFTGRFFGMFLPSTLGLDAYRLYDSIKQTKKPVECTAVIAVEKLIGFVSLFGLVFLTLPLGMKILPQIEKPLVLASILLFLALFIVFVLLLLFWPKLAITLVKILPFPMKARFQKGINQTIVATTAYSDKKLLLVKAIALGFVVHIATILMYFGTMRSILTANVNIFDIFFASPLMIMGTVFGPSIGGEGIRELIFTLLLSDKAGAAKAFLLAHLGFWVGEFLVSLPGAVFYSLRPANYRVLKQEDLLEIKKLGQAS